jgi:hypothetical protein
MPRPRQNLTVAEVLERYEHKKELGRIRQKAFYDKNAARVLEQQKTRRDELMDVVRENRGILPPPRRRGRPPRVPDNAPPPPPPPAPIPVAERPLLEKTVLDEMKVTDYYTNESSRQSDLSNARLVFRAIKGDDLMGWIKRPDDLIAALNSVKKQTGGEYALSQRQKLGGVVLNIIKIMKLEIPREIDKKLFNYFRTSKLHYDMVQKATNNQLDPNVSVLSFDKIVAQTLAKYKKDSIEYLLVKMYQDHTLRNDYAQAILINDSSQIEPDKNYIILGAGRASFVIQKHKSVKDHGVLRGEFSAETTELLKKYIKARKLKPGEIIFGKLTSPALHNITQSSGKDLMDGGARVLRRSAASTLFDKWKNGQATIEDIYHQIQSMAHNSSTHRDQYIVAIR